MSNIGKTVRDFSAAGPCIAEGVIIRETPTMLEIEERSGSRRRIFKRGQRWSAGLLHVEPCRSCRDHANTQYPNGYDN